MIEIHITEPSFLVSIATLFVLLCKFIFVIVVFYLLYTGLIDDDND